MKFERIVKTPLSPLIRGNDNGLLYSYYIQILRKMLYKNYEKICKQSCFDYTLNDILIFAFFYDKNSRESTSS